jgi:hypothetical protein
MSLILSALALTYSSRVITEKNPGQLPKLFEYSQDTLQLSVMFKKEVDVTKEFRDIFDSLSKQGIMVDVYACDYQTSTSSEAMSEVCDETGPFYQHTAFPVYSATYNNSSTRNQGGSLLFKPAGAQFMSEVQELAKNAPNKLLAKPGSGDGKEVTADATNVACKSKALSPDDVFILLILAIICIRGAIAFMDDLFRMARTP